MNEHTRRGHAPHDELDGIADIEGQIGQIVQNRSQGASRQSLEDISRAAAEAMMVQYEASARTVEQMGEAAREELARLEVEMLAKVNETAATIRAQGKQAQALAEKVGALTKNVRDICVDVARKVGG